MILQCGFGNAAQMTIANGEKVPTLKNGKETVWRMRYLARPVVEPVQKNVTVNAVERRFDRMPVKWEYIRSTPK